MTNYWFCVSFEKEFDSEIEAENFLDNEIGADIYQNDVKDLSMDFEERTSHTLINKKEKKE